MAQDLSKSGPEAIWPENSKKCQHQISSQLRADEFLTTQTKPRRKPTQLG
jgi:hypothetical protein